VAFVLGVVGEAAVFAFLGADPVHVDDAVVGEVFPEFGAPAVLLDVRVVSCFVGTCDDCEWVVYLL
jgi:hypothetical protein